MGRSKAWICNAQRLAPLVAPLALSCAQLPGHSALATLSPPEPGVSSPAVHFRGWMFAPAKTVSAPRDATAPEPRAFILRGTRWIDHPDGSIERAREVFREEDVKALALPPHLGSGFLFYAASGGETLMWRADTWTGALRPLARVEPPVTEITSGFDRLYLASASSDTLRAIDAFSGQPRDLTPLPAAAAYGDLVFSDPWQAVVLAGVQGALATFDAGESWHPLGPPVWVTELDTSPAGHVVLATEGARFELDAGRLVLTSARGRDALFAGAETFLRFGQEAFAKAPAQFPEPLPLGERPLRSALLAGYPDTPDSAVVVERGVVARVRLSDGKLLGTQPHAGALPCRGVALGAGFGFVCGDADGPTEVYAHENGRLELEFATAAPRTVRSSGNGGLIVEARCSELMRAVTTRTRPPQPARNASSSEYCARSISGELLAVRVRGDTGAARVAALRDGRVAIVIPPRSGVPGRLSLISKGSSTSVELSIAGEAGPGHRLVRSGSWLDELWQDAEGRLGAWVIGSQTFAGVRINLEGELEISRLEEGVAETSFHGPFALHIVASGNVRETLDHGFEWHVSELPPALISSPPPTSRALRGCGPAGCVHDDWLRVGWSGDEAESEPARPEPPEDVAHSAPSFAFWNLSCAPSGASKASEPAPITRAEAPKPAETSSLRATRSAPKLAPESSAWLAFQGRAAPQRRAGELGYDSGETNENGAYRAYVWGPTTGDWSRTGSWLLRVGDRFSTAAPWSTALTRSPFPDASDAARVFGLDPNVGVDWWLRLSATGDFGVLSVRARSEAAIHLIERDRAITTLQAGTLNDLGSVAGAVKLDDQWYIGLTRAEQFQLYRIDRDKPELVATYPLWGRIVTQLIGSVHGDAMALWQKSSGSGWYVYPINATSFQPEPALHIPNDKLGRVPPVCEPGRPGWLAVSGVPLTDSALSESNTHLSFSELPDRLETKRLTARIVVDDTGVCVDALSALADGTFAPPPIAPARKTQRGTLPLTVTNPMDERRYAFRCQPE